MLKKVRVVEDAGFIATPNLVAHLVFIVKSQAVVVLVGKTERMSGLLKLVRLLREMNS